MKLVFLDEDSLGYDNIEEIRSLGDYTGYHLSTYEEALERVAEADVIIVNKVRIDGPLMDRAPKLKLIAETATGVNNIDLEAAKERGIAVRNVAGYSTDAVVQSTFAHMLALLTLTRYFDDRVKSGEYSALPLFCDMSRQYTDIAGKTIGIIGMGAIGQKVARIAEAFGMKVIYYSTSGTSHCTEYPSVSLEELLAEADVVSIHAPLNPKTKGLIGKQQFELMKPTAIILNLGRGGIIVEKDLAEAINNETIAGAGLDVFEVEPLPADSPLLTVKFPDRLSLSPHTAWASKESLKRLIHLSAENIRTFF